MACDSAAEPTDQLPVVVMSRTGQNFVERRQIIELLEDVIGTSTDHDIHIIPFLVVLRAVLHCSHLLTESDGDQRVIDLDGRSPVGSCSTVGIVVHRTC